MSHANEKLVLLTRPYSDSKALAEDLEELGYRCLISPMLNIDPLDFVLPPLPYYQGLVFTSANAVRVLAAKTAERSLPVFAVGARTAQEAMQKGWGDVVAAPGDLDKLEELLLQVKLPNDKPLLHVCGEDIVRPVNIPGIKVDKLVVYKAEAVAQLPKDVMGALEERKIYAVLFYSARTARIFNDVLAQAGMTDAVKRTCAVCISKAAQSPLISLPWRGMYVACTPDGDGMMRALEMIEAEKN